MFHVHLDLRNNIENIPTKYKRFINVIKFVY